MSPWERQPNENEDAWAAFLSFRDSRPPRRVLGTKGMYSTEQLYRWANDHAWYDRAAAYDRHFDAIVVAEREDVLRRHTRDIGAEYLMLAHEIEQTVLLETRKLLETCKENAGPNILKPGEIAKLAEMAMKLDRTYRELPTERNEIDFNKFTLEQWKEICGKK